MDIPTSSTHAKTLVRRMSLPTTLVSSNTRDCHVSPIRNGYTPYEKFRDHDYDLG